MTRRKVMEMARRDVEIKFEVCEENIEIRTERDIEITIWRAENVWLFALEVAVVADKDAGDNKDAASFCSEMKKEWKKWKAKFEALKAEVA